MFPELGLFFTLYEGSYPWSPSSVERKKSSANFPNSIVFDIRLNLISPRQGEAASTEPNNFRSKWSRIKRGESLESRKFHMMGESRQRREPTIRRSGEIYVQERMIPWPEFLRVGPVSRGGKLWKHKITLSPRTRPFSHTLVVNCRGRPSPGTFTSFRASLFSFVAFAAVPLSWYFTSL